MEQNLWILEDGNHPKLIEYDDFNKVQEKLKLRGEIKGRAVGSQGLLTGLVKCDRCGRSAFYKRRSPIKYGDDRAFYGCSSYYRSKTCQAHVISAKKLHNIVLGELEKIAKDKNYRSKLMQTSFNTRSKGQTIQISELQKTIKSIDDRQNRLLMAYESSVLTLEQFGEAKRKLDDETIRLSSELEKLLKESSDTSRAKEAKAKFLKFITNFNSQFNKLSHNQQKQLLQSLIERVGVKGNRVSISYRV